MFNPTRDQARQFQFDTWSKYRNGQPMTALEKQLLEILLQHPEYHHYLESPEKYLARDYRPEQGEMNPFLHLSLHLAIAEQLSIDQPPGILARYEKLRARHGDAHQALHQVMECLGEMVWQAQRRGGGPDPAVYFDCLDRNG